MGVVQKDHWYIMVLLFLPFLKGTAQQKHSTVIHLEEGMVLDCLCPWKGNLTMVSWTKEPDKHPIAVFHPEYGIATAHAYRQRIEFLRTTPMDGSISMNNVTHQDIGLYMCSIQTFPQGPWNQYVQVEDLDEPPEEDYEEEEEEGAGGGGGEEEDDKDELREPTTPEVMEVDTELAAEKNNNLTFNCYQKHNGAVYQVVVDWMAPGQRWSIVGVCDKVEGGVVTKAYSDRSRISCEDNLNVSVHLTGVGQEDAGLYRCTYKTDVGMLTNTVLLTVPSPGSFSLSVYMMYLYMGTGAAGLILLTVMIILVMNRRRKNRREEYRVKLHPKKQSNI